MICSNCKHQSSSDTGFSTKEQLETIANFFKENNDAERYNR